MPGLPRGRLSPPTLTVALDGSVRAIAMLHLMLAGATASSCVFHDVGGETSIVHAVDSLGPGERGPLAMMILVAGFFDWTEITLRLLPLFAPGLAGIDPGGHVARRGPIHRFAVLLAVDRQPSFLAPPSGAAPFHRKNAAAIRVRMGGASRGIVPFTPLQILVLALLGAFSAVRSLQARRLQGSRAAACSSPAATASGSGRAMGRPPRSPAPATWRGSSCRTATARRRHGRGR